MKDYDHIARRITIVLFLSQSLSSAGFIAAFTVNALVGVELSGKRAMAGVPGGLYVAGQACGAMIWSFTMERIGRDWGWHWDRWSGLSDPSWRSRRWSIVPSPSSCSDSSW